MLVPVDVPVLVLLPAEAELVLPVTLLDPVAAEDVPLTLPVLFALPVVMLVIPLEVPVKTVTPEVEADDADIADVEPLALAVPDEAAETVLVESSVNCPE